MLQMHREDRRAQSGFTLVEILVALAIVGGLVAIFYPMVSNMRAQGKKKTARIEMKQIQAAIDHYQEDVKSLPESLNDLIKGPASEEAAKKFDGPYLPKKEMPKDPWGKTYKYEPTPGGEHEYELYVVDPSDKKRISVWTE